MVPWLVPDLKLMLKINQEKYLSFKRLFPQDSSDIKELIMGTREILKGAKGCEYEILPLPSVLRLQERRAEIVTLLWTGKLNNEDPKYFGFEMKEDNWKPKLQKNDDHWYSHPKTCIKGWGWRSKCSEQKKKCNCLKDEGKGNTCSPFTCKNCKCFKRVQDSEEEDLTLSNQYQDYIDQMSDEEDLNISDQYQSDEYESELEDSFESLEHDDENTEFVELDDSFTE